GADHFEQQLADGLLDLRALDLEDRGGRVRPVALAVALGGDDAELRHLQRLKLHFDRRVLARKRSSSISGRSSARSSAASSRGRRMRSFDMPTRAMPVRSLPSRNLA